MRFSNIEQNWIKYKVSELLTCVSTNSLTWNELSYDEESSLKNIHYGLIHNGFTTTCISCDNKLIPYVNIKNFPKQYSCVEKGDIILADASEDRKDVGRAIEIIDISDEIVISGLHTIHAKNKSDLFETGYKGYYFNSNAMKKQIHRIANGSKIYSISPSNFNELYISIPNKHEQTKIVSLLSLIELRIETQIKIISDLNILKKNINNYFFNDINEFDSFSINDVGYIYNGLSGKTKEDFGRGYPFIPYTNIYNNDVVDITKLQYVNIINDFQNKVLYGDILFTASSETPYEVGMAAIYLSNIEPIYLNSFSLGLRITNKNINKKYVCYLFQSNYFRKIIFKYSQGSTRYNLNRESLINCKMKFHKFNIQEKIVNILDGINMKISNESIILENYISQKQYLLSNLFV